MRALTDMSASPSEPVPVAEKEEWRSKSIEFANKRKETRTAGKSGLRRVVAHDPIVALAINSKSKPERGLAMNAFGTSALLVAMISVQLL